MSKTVSVIIPIYNVEKYLDRCISSVINQTYNDLEIILVDDGSTDNSGAICDRYASIEKRIKVIHKKNGGLSDARNYGIDNSTGEYIVFIDSDDWIDKDFVETYLKIAISKKADLVIGKLKYVSNERVAKSGSKELIHLSKKEAFSRMFLGDGTIISACAKLYSKNLFKKYRYDYGQLYEDFLLFDKLIDESKNIYYTDYSGYFYYLRNGSIVRSNFTEKRLILIEKARYYINYAKEHYPDLVNAAIRRYIVSCFTVLSTAVTNIDSNSYAVDIRHLILKHKTSIFLRKEYSFKEKAQTALLMMGLTVYRWILQKYQTKKNKDTKLC